MKARPRPNDPSTSTAPSSREALVKCVTHRLLRYAPKRKGINIIIILGHLRSGKSSLFESLTGSTGHSKDGIESVTREYQLGAANIGGKVYLFVDTPGLDDANISNADILCEIASLLHVTKDSVQYTGILFVHSVGIQFSDETKRGLQFLESFCGLEYAPSVTFVTTMWDEFRPSGVESKAKLMRELSETKWGPFIERGANVYHHGRVYQDGVPTLEVQDIKEKAEERQICARELIARLYPTDRDHVTPLIIQELRLNMALENTTAGKFLCMTSQQLIPATTERNRVPDQQGFNWFGMIATIIAFPLAVVTGFASALFDFISTLCSLLSLLRPSVSIHRFTHDSVEVLVTLRRGLRFIVGYGELGPYWRFRSFQEVIGSDDLSDDGISDLFSIGSAASDMLEIYPSDIDGLRDNPEYQAFTSAFEQAHSMPDSTRQGREESGTCCTM